MRRPQSRVPAPSRVGVEPGPERRTSAAGLVDRLAAGAVDVVLGDDGGAGLDLRRDGAAVERGDGHVDPVLADRPRLLGDECLDRAGVEVLDLVGPGVEADDLHRVRLAGLLDAVGAALGGEEVGGEDADEVRVLLQRGAHQVRRGGRVVVGVLDADVLELRVGLHGVLEPLRPRVGGGDAGVDRHHHDLAAVRVECLERLEGRLAARLVVGGDRGGRVGRVLGRRVDENDLGA